MSNFICPTCGMTNIDCSKEDYKTDREIALEKKLEIAISALEEIYRIDEGNSFFLAEEALTRIKEIKR